MDFNNNSVCGAIEVLRVRYNPSLGCLCRGDHSDEAYAQRGAGQYEDEWTCRLVASVVPQQPNPIRKYKYINKWLHFVLINYLNASSPISKEY